MSEPDAHSTRAARDRRFMELALDLARAAAEAGEVPIGAVLVRGDEILAKAANRTRCDLDPTAHAEVLTLRAAARATGDLRLPGTTLYTTVEPCLMCAGALLHARVERVVWATRDPKFGAAASLGRVFDEAGANHRIRWEEGVHAEQSAELLRSFFRPLREGLKERRRDRRREE
ncbi:MAG: tRNA adenosine(34) deaminase TadA [Planctomycetota bacterium]|jgi:tRNA(adenine34) deaminase